jgi:transposase-like protein
MSHINYKKRPELKFTDTIKQMPVRCSDELAAVEFFEQTRWGDTPCCPRCGDTDVLQLRDKKTGERNKRFLWKCHGCRKQYTVRIGTVYEESRIALRHWCLAFWLMTASKKGISALQLMRLTGVSYKSALFLAHRVRFAMKPATEQPKLTGVVECDETYVGGKPRHDRDKRAKWSSKTPVLAALQRGGDVRVAVVPNVTSKNVGDHMRKNIDGSAHIVTDEHAIYPGIAGFYFDNHSTVNHSAGEYTRGDVTTNTVEGFFSILKRGLNGVYHAVSKEHLHRYLSEFEFRYNARKVTDGERVLLAVRGADGKRLMYREQSGEAA